MAILIGLGSNLQSRFGTPEQTLEAAFDCLKRDGTAIVARSHYYRSAPVPASDQPDFVNAVAVLAGEIAPATLLARLHAIEGDFARVRLMPNAARTLDLDLLDFDSKIDDGWPRLPHPRIAERLFVLMPMKDVAPAWRHPRTGLAIDEMIAAIRSSQRISRIIR